MISSQPIRLQNLTPAFLKELACQQGDCTTLVIPGSTGAREGGSRAAGLRYLLQSTPAGSLDTHTLEPLDEFARRMEDEGGGPGVALFRSATFLATTTAPGLKAASMVRGSHFAVTAVAAAALAPQELFVLALHSKNLHLLHYKQGICTRVPLPAGVPADIGAALAFDAPDHLLEGRSGASRGTGRSGAIRFGTSSDKESEDEYLHHYFRIFDRALKPWIGDKPILLAGIHSDVTAFHRAAPSTWILEGELGGNIDFLRPGPLCQHD